MPAMMSPFELAIVKLLSQCHGAAAQIDGIANVCSRARRARALNPVCRCSLGDLLFDTGFAAQLFDWQVSLIRACAAKWAC